MAPKGAIQLKELSSSLIMSEKEGSVHVMIIQGEVGVGVGAPVVGW